MKKLLLPILLFIVFVPFYVKAETCYTDKISISSISLHEKSGNAEEVEEANVSGKNINLNISMLEVGDSVEYKILINNNSNEDYKLDNASLSINFDYINYLFKTDDNSNVVRANSSKNITLRVEYKKEVPEDRFENDSFIDNNAIALNLFTRDTIQNPNTGVQSLLLIIIILLVSMSSYILLRKKKYIKFMILIVVATIIVPISVCALCKYDITISSNIIINKQAVCGSFDGDSWNTIISNVKNGNDDCYHIGDSKEVDMGTFGTYTLRIVNKSIPFECNQEGFSQTACGFVLEFENIIAEYNMNTSMTNVGGWPISAMRWYLNDINNSTSIYNLLPDEIKNSIIDTTVVSGHGPNDSANFTTIDKIYLLSSHEIWEDINDILHNSDTAYSNTRQLDYYQELNTTVGFWDSANSSFIGNFAPAIKKTYNESQFKSWWLRSAYSNYYGSFLSVTNTGLSDNFYAESKSGVVPVFRIG